MANTKKGKGSEKPSLELSGPKEVAEFIAKLKHPLKNAVEMVREIILNSDRGITEHIKWKAPSFCVNGEDRVTFNLHKSDHILLVFHRGAKGKESKGKGSLFNDTTGLLDWVSDERAIVKFQSLSEVTEKKDKLRKVVKQWIKSAGS